MKKIIAVVMILALFSTGMIFAQSWEFWGGFGTGLRLTTFGGGDDWLGPTYDMVWVPDPTGGLDYTQRGHYVWTMRPTDRAPYAPGISLLAAEEGTFLDLRGKYTNRNFGLYGSVRLLPFSDHLIEIHGLFGWMTFFNDTLMMRIGRVQDHLDHGRGRGYVESLFPLWAAPGAKDCEYSYAEGDGIRFEYTGIRGLNIGVCFYLPHFSRHVYLSNRNNSITGRPDNYYKNQIAITGWMENAVNTSLRDFFMNTAFGLEYKSRSFDFAAGLKLDSVADGISDSQWGTTYFGAGLWGLYDGPQGPRTAPSLLDRIDGNNILDFLDKGMKAYAGIHLKMFRPWNIKFGGQFFNLGIFDEYGWMHLNQVLSYNLRWRYGTISLSAMQTIFNIYDDRSDPFAAAWDDEFHSPGSFRKSRAIFTFKPEFSFFGSAHTLYSIDVPVTIWPRIVIYDISVRPSVTYFIGRFLGTGLNIDFRYIFNIMQFSKYSNAFVDGIFQGRTVFRNSDPLIQNVVQVNFRVSF
jgi:hypothetical protein